MTDELYHYGVKGMKWGVRRDKQYREDNKIRKSLKRQTAATKKHLATRGEMAANTKAATRSAEYDYRQANKKITFSKAKKRAAIAEATKKLRDANDAHLEDQAEYLRAERHYDTVSAKYKAHVDKMIKDYGSENVKSLKTKTVSYGEQYVKNVVKTGITIANIPIIGTMYTGNLVSDLDIRDKRSLLDEKARKRY